MKTADLRLLSIDELNAKETDLRKELFNLRLLLSKGELQNNMTIKAVRKDIARILTIITEKEASEGAAARGKANA
ncbi:MAG: 50S ribosomal protein L29 [Nitrospiraceae bacterium]|nr:50S ribosomal protein L29 [Nitrospiraceae bacterium]